MGRADFWCRVIGGLQIAAGAAVALTLFLAIRIVDLSFLPPAARSLLPVVLFLLIGLPQVLTGGLMLRFAALVQAEREGRAVGDQAALRVILSLSGLWAGGLIGIFGFAAPHLGLFSLLALASVAAAVLGPRGTANLIAPGA
jgi:hypothetical protein